MVDDVFRSYRNHDTVDPEGSEPTARGGIGDPLAELARLTGQPYGDGGRDGGQIGRRTTPVPSSVSRARSIVLPSSVPNHPLWRDPNHPLWRDSAGSRRSSRPPDIFPAPQSNSNGVAEDASDHPAAIRKIQYSRAGQPASPGRDDQQPVLPSARTPTFLPTVPDGRHAGEMRATETDETLRAYSFYDARPSPRWRLVMVIAVLAGLGVVSAFVYRAVFWGAALPTLPPLMAAENGPKKIVPNYGVPIAPRDAAPLPAVEPPAPTAASVPPPALAIPASHSSEPKKVHTIIIRSDRSEQIDTSAAAVTHSATSPRAPGTR
jgi:hypothetical protein